MLNAHQITVSFGGETLFDGISFRLGKGDRVGLIGKNGAGKSTLLRLMSQENTPTSGTFAFEKNCKIGYLPQDLDFEHGRTVLEEAYLAFEEIKSIEQRQEAIHQFMETTQDFESQSYFDQLDELNEARCVRCPGLPDCRDRRRGAAQCHSEGIHRHLGPGRRRCGRIPVRHDGLL